MLTVMCEAVSPAGDRARRLDIVWMQDIYLTNADVGKRDTKCVSVYKLLCCNSFQQRNEGGGGSAATTTTYLPHQILDWLRSLILTTSSSCQ